MSRVFVKKLLGGVFACLVLAVATWSGYRVDLLLAQNHDVKPSVPSPAPETKPIERKGLTKQATSTNADVVRVVDGDTIIVRLDAEPERTFNIRFLGINTPETVDPRRSVQCFGKEASNKMKGLLTGKRVRLDADPLADEVDKYGRLLRNVYTEDGLDVNAYMVTEGYANAYVNFPQNPLRKAELRRLEREAKAAGRGLWAADACVDFK